MTRTCRLSWLVLALIVSFAPSAFADEYLAYTQGGIPAGADIFTWCDTPPCDLSEVTACATPEGGSAFSMNQNVWGGWGLFLQAGLADLSAYDNGEIRFFVKSANDLKVEFQCRPAASDVTYTTFLTQHGWDGTNTWQEITIPVASFFAPDPVDPACIGNVYSPFLTTVENLPFFANFQIDYVRWETPSPPHAGASSVQVQGRQLLVDGEPFVINAMAYAPVGVGDNWQSAWRDRADRYNIDFPLIAASGANTVRLYAPILTTAMLDAAWAEGLHVIPTFGVDGIQLECAQGKAYLQDRFVETVQKWKDHPAILSWLIGNEVNLNLGAADLCVDWYPQLDAMALAGHNAEGAAFHPIGTGAADNSTLADVCIPGCSDDLALPNVDYWGVQVYRGCSFGSTFNDYAAKTNCDRPMVVTEFGSDAFNRPGGAPGVEDETMQANCLGTLLDEADQALAARTPGGVSSGQVIFAWSDEWWKAECDPTTSWTEHDTCPSFVNFGYPDPNIHEEWWGITTLDPVDPNVRGLRSAHTVVGESWHMGDVCNLDVVTFDDVSGDTTVSFDPSPGSTDHTLHYGPLNAVSSYGYSGSVSGLGATGSSSITLPPGSLFWLVVGRNNGAEGDYGTGVTERPPSSGAAVPQDPNRSGLCSSP